MSSVEITRRRVIKAFGVLPAFAETVAGQPQLAGEPPGRIAPMAELINTLEFELMAKAKLPAAVFATIAGSDRRDFERCTFRPRLMVDSTGLDLTTVLFGESMFAPIIIGPASSQMKIHPEGELATVRGASAAKAVTIIGDNSSHPIERIVAESKGPLWYQVYAAARQVERAERGVKLGCKVIVVTVENPLKPDWPAIGRLQKGIAVPVVVKGIITPNEAENAVKQGAAGIIVSSYGAPAAKSSFAMLPAIADAVGGRIPVLIDGSFRRGTDILKALILGAQGVLVTRPPMWGLGAYGADGVQAVMEMLQSELARNMILIGAASARALSRDMVRMHK